MLTQVHASSNRSGRINSVVKVVTVLSDVKISTVEINKGSLGGH